MTLTIDLTPEQEERLRSLAAAEGKTVEEYLRASILQLSSRPMTGAEALAYWKQKGVRGVYASGPDSPELARQLRQAEEARGRQENAASEDAA